MHKPPNGRSGPEDRKLLKTKGCTHVLNDYSQLEKKKKKSQLLN